MAVLAVLVALTFSGALMSPASAGNGNNGNSGNSGNAGTSGDVSKPQPESKADQNEGGANGQCTEGPYCSTRDGSASKNGSDVGEAKGKPCAGCVGKADNKNPQGQKPGGSDNNAGYECDRNQGVGQGNPAHTGCTPGSETPDDEVNPTCTPGKDEDCTPPGKDDKDDKDDVVDTSCTPGKDEDCTPPGKDDEDDVVDTSCTPGKDEDCTPPGKDDEDDVVVIDVDDDVVVIDDVTMLPVGTPVDTTVTTGTGAVTPAEIAGVEMERAQLVNGAGSTALAQSGSAGLPQTGAAANLAALGAAALGLVLAGALAMSRQRRLAHVNN